MDLLVSGPRSARTTLVLAHGAGAPMDSPFMNELSARLSAAKLRVVRFEFAYMAARRSGQRRPPDPPARLLARWHEAIAAAGAAPKRLVIGGKSMGGRIASLIADEVQPRGLVCLGYPFHPAGKPERLRTAHLAALRTPTLIVQGTRDALGSAQDVAGYALSRAIELVWLEDGDHSWKPRARTGRSLTQALDEGAAAITAFVRRCERR